MSGRADTAFVDQSSDEGLRVEIKRAQNDYRVEKAREAQIQTEAELEIQLSHLRLQTAQDTELTNQAILETNRRELDLRNHLTEVGKQQGLLANDVSEVNKTKYLSEIKLEENWKTIVQDLDAGDLLEISDQQVLNKLTSLLADQYRERHQIEIGDDPPQVKDALVLRYNKNIRYLEDKIDGRQAGLVLPKNRQETLGLGEGEAQGSGRGSEATQTD